MGVDRGMVRAFGYFGGAVIALSVGASVAIALATDKLDAMFLFLPLIAGFSLFVTLFATSLALYVFIRSRTQKLH